MLASSLLLDIEKMRTRYMETHGNDKNFKDEFTTRKILEYVVGEPQAGKDSLRVFDHVWDFEGDRYRLKEEVGVIIDME